MEILVPMFSSEASGYLLPDLDHADIAFRLIIVKGNEEVVHERQCFDPAPIQSVQ